MKIGITGITGFIGKKLAQVASAQGHHIVGISRQTAPMLPGESERRVWNSSTGVELSGLDAVIHLAGESIMGRWTSAKKKRILSSRIETTQALVSQISEMKRRGEKAPSLISASGIGFYGDSGDEWLDETRSQGKGFLPEVVSAWESTALAAQEHTRVVIMRIGIVLGNEGGAWPAMRRLFLLGLGGPLAGGKMWISWIHLDDLVQLLLTAAREEKYRGIYNASAPHPVRNDEWTREIARVVRRPAFWPVPAWALRLLMGEQVSIILDSLRATPQRLLDEGFTFAFPQLSQALDHLES